MKAASIQEIKSAINELDSKKLREVCLRLAKHKKENKELLSYLLFESDNEEEFIQQVKADMEIQFQEVNTSNLYFAKKTFRKILRSTNKHIRFIGSKAAEAELLICYCQLIKKSGIAIKDSVVLMNLYKQQQKKIAAAVATLHEDLQFDFQKNIEAL
ncbi:MAG: hypothetical protein EYC69_08825 [Bacteroidetes bacterium]|nr:MAG: hypothetical protein EYC69_08825 [Bacteroidota bacterium]